MKNIIYIVISVSFLFSACVQIYPLDLGEGYKIDYDGNSYFCLLDSNNTIVVDAHITNFKFDSTFIVVEQKPVDLILSGTWNDPEMNLKKRDIIFEKSTLRLYWIINKKEAHLYGPYSKHDYLVKLKELKISPELILTPTNKNAHRK